MSLRRAGFHVVAGVAGVVAAGVAVNQVLNDSKWNWWALGIAIGIAAVAESVKWRLDHYPPGSGVASAQQVDDAAAALARLVAGQWESEAELRSLEDPDPIPVRWLLTPDPGLADAAGQAAAAGWEASSAEIEELAVQFRALRRRRLVVLGGPGSGKTTLAVQLLRELLRTRGEDGREPVPVLLSASSWDTAVHRGVWEWMAAQLALTYPALKAEAYGPDACRDLVTGPDPRVLPVIDGLDEIPPPARIAVLEALNRSLGRGQLILTCRTTDWADAVTAAGTVLGGAAVIEPDPLTPRKAAGYLRRCLRRAPSPAWQHLLDHLTAQDDTPATPLAEVCSTPLGLWLVRTVYQPPATSAPAPDPTPLTDPNIHPTADDLRAHLFDQLIPALIRQRPPSTDPRHLFRPRRLHDPDDADRWLTWLARHLTHPRSPEGQPRTRDFAWWHLARHTLTLEQLKTTTARTLGIMAGLMFGLLVGLTGGRHHAWWCYLLATVRLSRRGVLPRDLMDFLDDAHRLGLLRAVGPMYQFRHADFQDHFARAASPETMEGSTSADCSEVPPVS